MEHNESFKMTYSARQQEEIQAIRRKYMAPEENKMDQLRALDAGAAKKAAAVSLIAGIAGTLMMGTGMSLTISDFGKPLGAAAMPLGIAVGLLGIGIMVCAHPLYRRVLKKEREKIAPRILRLTDELLEPGIHDQ